MTTAVATDRLGGVGEVLDLDALAVQTVRFLAADMVQEAGSGHPGMPMGAAPMAWTLFSRYLKHDPSKAAWPDRDRFVLSAGHGSTLQYALLHLFGYGLPETELRRFRQLGSRTPGHPEFGHTDGVETTTGPLGQGMATAVGMAIAERMLAARFSELVDHRTWAIVGDGCLMEGVSQEAASLAGHLRLGRLVVLFDDNGITIDGTTDRSCSDDHLRRFSAYGWHVAHVDDGADITAIDAALREATADPRPSLIAVRTVIGHGAPGVEGTSKAHGSPLGDDTLSAARDQAGWPRERFFVPDQVRAHCAGLAAEGRATRLAWDRLLARFASDQPKLIEEWHRTQSRLLPLGLGEALASVPTGLTRATRQASQSVLRTVTRVMPELVGGSADLAGSTGTDTGRPLVTREDFSGSELAFGVREFAMAAILNGMSLHGGFRVFGSTFLVFSDYLRPALRLSALMRQPVIYVLSHDSIAVGEDGPTHQPVEHIESLRLIPGLAVLRPADDHETLEAWELALRRTAGPTVLVLSRQGVPSLPADRTGDLASSGARVVRADPDPRVEFLATGSEVDLALRASELLSAEGIPVRVLSVPWRERFNTTRLNRDTGPVSVSVEAGATAGWRGVADHCFGLDAFGVSAPGDAVLSHFGFTAKGVADAARRAIAEASGNVQAKVITRHRS